ncbi:MAG TPA: LysM peptidoglycan-binding domain-containing protein [Pyrinomonadaceae bacterium]|jgi:murein DD-endopeptidase MepM/ murein hydrolase activator NlpD|nr:LysM peptidoglycan-binding domain-containing protein [Pyrinomonadaceae bacterium]
MTYTIKAGDTLSKIAARNRLTLAQLLQANPQITDPNRIKVGDVVNLPNGSAATDATQPLPATPVNTSSTDNTQPLPSKPGTTAAGALGTALADELGCLSAKYETGGRGPGVVSTGVGDPGGVSYGSYQMASKMGVPQRFVCQSGFPWAKDFQNLTAGSAEFTACWKRIAATQTADFQKAQHAFIKQSHYDLLASKILAEDKLDVNTRSFALQNVIWSTAVQHGGATPIVHRAIANLSCTTSDPTYDKQLICAIYTERGRRKPDGNLAYFSRSSPSVQAGVAKRFQNEQADALAMLAKET